MSYGMMSSYVDGRGTSPDTGGSINGDSHSSSQFDSASPRVGMRKVPTTVWFRRRRQARMPTVIARIAAELGQKLRM